MIATGLQAAFLALRFTSLVEQICQGPGGPCDALVQDIGKSLHRFKVPPREPKELAVLLAPIRQGYH